MGDSDIRTYLVRIVLSMMSNCDLTLGVWLGTSSMNLQQVEYGLSILALKSDTRSSHLLVAFCVHSKGWSCMSYDRCSRSRWGVFCKSFVTHPLNLTVNLREESVVLVTLCRSPLKSFRSLAIESRWNIIIADCQFLS